METDPNPELEQACLKAQASLHWGSSLTAHYRKKTQETDSSQWEFGAHDARAVKIYFGRTTKIQIYHRGLRGPEQRVRNRIE